MHPTLKLFGLAIAPLVLSLPIAVVIGERNQGAIAQETISEKKAEGDRLLQQGVQQYKIGQFKSALQFLQEALQIYRSINDRRGEGNALGNLGSAYDALGNSAKAVEYFEQTLVVMREIQNQRGEGQALNMLGSAYWSLGSSFKAIEYLEQSLDIFRQILDPQGEGDALGNLGSIYLTMGNSAKAIEYHQQSLALARKTNDPRGEGASLNNLGIDYYTLSNYAKAIEYYQQSLALARQIKDPQLEGNTLGGLGNAQWSLDNYTEAIKYYQQSLDVFRAISDQRGEGASLSNLGRVHWSLGNYAKAINYHQQSLALARQIKDPRLEGNTLGGLGSVYFSLGNYAKAIEYHRERVAIAQQIKDPQLESSALGDLGNVYNALGNYTKAIEHHQQRLAITQQIKDRQGEGAALGDLGIVHYYLGEYATAIYYEEQQLAIAQEIEDRSGKRNSLANLGNAYNALGDYAKAIEYHQQSLAIAQEIKSQNSQGIALNNLGLALFNNRRTEDAEVSLLKAVEIWESLRFGLTDTQRRSLFEEQAKTYRFLQQVQIALQKPEAALETSDRGRARAFIELLAARFSGETLENAIAKQKVAKLSLPQIQQVSKTQTATLVQYSIASDQDLYIYIIQPDGSIHFRKGDISTLGKSLNDFVNASRNKLGVRDRGDIVVSLTPEKEQELREQRDRALRQLHQLLIEPIADLLLKNENDRVIFMPQGELFLVPFPALLNAQNQPLITQHTILTAPSIQTLDLTHKTAQALPKGNRPALVVGNPAMPTVTTIIGNPPHKLAPLAGSETEAKAIAKQLNTQAITGNDAKKDAIVQKMQNAGIIHLATHGLLDGFKGDTPGAIALAPNGTNQPNDGLLTSGEIFDLKLNANLVVLSACDTGRGDITGDGVIGLSRSLFVAGVPSVIVSLWKVPDDSTAFLMTEFYRNWRERKLDKAQALRKAMLSTRDKYPQPLNWAAFTLIGEAE
ncbi:MAG: tetratricopeptide repeat protein [Tildeniella nuda ZEHNDER 1965/U140]|jgi:CHAT domain-containing protein/Flp pilus assembly protein TadD|nr:tetratricopeptide repeat protein [Tildeniella nuda ZEHNDER 1965/U140]